MTRAIRPTWRRSCSCEARASSAGGYQAPGQADPPGRNRCLALALSTFLAALALKAYWVVGAAAAMCLRLWAVRRAAVRGMHAAGLWRGLGECGLFVAGAGVPCLVVFMGCWRGGYARAMLSDVFGLATRFVSVTPGCALEAAAFIGERLLNLTYLVAGAWAVWAAVRGSRFGHRCGASTAPRSCWVCLRRLCRCTCGWWGARCWRQACSW